MVHLATAEAQHLDGRQLAFALGDIRVGQRKHHHKRQARRHKGHEHHDRIDNRKVRLIVFPMLGRTRNRKPTVTLKILAKRNLVGRRTLKQHKDAVKACTSTERALIGALRHVKRVAQIVERDVADFDLGNIERRILDVCRIARLDPQHQLRALAQIHVSVTQGERFFGLILQAHVIAQVTRAVIGHHDQLHSLALTAKRKGDVVGHNRQRRSHSHVGIIGCTALIQCRARLRKIIGIGNRQQVIARDMPVLLGRQRDRRITDAHTANHKRRAARNAKDGHKGALFVAE